MSGPVCIEDIIAALEYLRSNMAIPNVQTDYGIRLAIQTVRSFDPKHQLPKPPEPKHRWITSNDGIPFCPICRNDSVNQQQTPFCAMCGTHMEVKNGKF